LFTSRNEDFIRSLLKNILNTFIIKFKFFLLLGLFCPILLDTVYIYIYINRVNQQNAMENAIIYRRPKQEVLRKQQGFSVL